MRGVHTLEKLEKLPESDFAIQFARQGVYGGLNWMPTQKEFHPASHKKFWLQR